MGQTPEELMARIDLPYIKRFKDRHGRLRHYFRRPGFKSVRLPGLPGSEEFMGAYATAGTAKKAIGAGRVKPGSFSALLIAYYASKEFRVLQPQTQKNYRGMLDKLAIEYGGAAVGDITRGHLNGLMDSMSEKPGAARTLNKRLKTVFMFALDRGWIEVDPSHKIKPPKNRSEGFKAWTDADITKFEAHWPIGSKSRLALDLYLYTGQRRSDVAKMGRQHVKGDVIFVKQLKTGVQLELPIHPNLQLSLSSLPKDNLTFLLTEYGRPFTVNGFGAWFKKQVMAAGLPDDLAAHGLRKATARRLAESGCSVHLIAAITGHSSLKGVEPYTKSANQPHLARAAMSTLRGVP